jgi:Raf kinase inhibitor-like YbhB/YbcL family protein
MEKPQIAAPGSKVYPAWIAKAEVEDLTTEAGLKEVTFVEMHDALFRTNSAVIMPEGEDPSSKKDGGRALTSVGLFATVLRYNELYPGKKVLIAGHTDTKGSDQFNQPLSEERAKVALALLLGKRDDFIKLCDKRHDEVDVTQIFEWAANAFGFACKPTTLLAAPSDERYHQFRMSFNAWVDARDPVVETDSRSNAAKLPDRGRLDKSIWGAIFDLYEYDLRVETEEMASGVNALRNKLVWVDKSRQTMGFGEKFPVDNLAKDDFRSQSNRRVEILMFDPGEEPDLAAAESNPEGTELYLQGIYAKRPVAMSSAGPDYAWVESESLVAIPDSPALTTPVFNDEIEEAKNDAFELSCPSFQNGEMLPLRHAGLHGNVSPAVSWTEPPSGTKEFVLVLYDPDATDNLHWVVRDISASVGELPEAAQLPISGSSKPASSIGNVSLPYRGPQPPANETHRYVIRLYALPLPLGVDKIPLEFSLLDALLLAKGATFTEVFTLYREA